VSETVIEALLFT